MTNKLIEIGTITDNSGKFFIVFSSTHPTLTHDGEDVVVEGIILKPELDDKEYEIHCESLSDIPNSFSQRQCDALELFILEEAQTGYKAYRQDLYTDSQRGEN